MLTDTGHAVPTYEVRWNKQIERFVIRVHGTGEAIWLDPNGNQVPDIVRAAKFTDRNGASKLLASLETDRGQWQDV